MESENPNEGADRLRSSTDQSLIELEDAVNALGQSFADHPGFMWTDSGFEVLHANWPAYPRGRGIRYTLSALAEYPQRTRFFRIDSVDQCTLFAVGEKPKQDPYGAQHLHVAVWDDDIRACAQDNYLEGVRHEDEFLDFADGAMRLTQKGLDSATVNALLGSALDSLEDEIIEHLHEARYDTAIREASLRVEVALRHTSGLSEHGRRLVESCFGEAGVLVPNGLTNAKRQILRNSFHAYFKYVRNEYAHNLPPVDMLTACMLVRRSSALRVAIRVMSRTHGPHG